MCARLFGEDATDLSIVVWLGRIVETLCRLLAICGMVTAVTEVWKTLPREHCSAHLLRIGAAIRSPSRPMRASDARLRKGRTSSLRDRATGIEPTTLSLRQIRSSVRYRWL